MSPDHLSKFFGTTTTLFRTALTMLHLVLRAFSAAGFCAGFADIVHELRTSTHQCRSGPTKVGAIAIEANTFRHHRDVLFAETRVGPMLAFLSTADTRFNARLKIFVTHTRSPKKLHVGNRPRKLAPEYRTATRVPKMQEALMTTSVDENRYFLPRSCRDDLSDPKS